MVRGVEVRVRSEGVWWEEWRCVRVVKVCGRSVVGGVEVCWNE